MGMRFASRAQHGPARLPDEMMTEDAKFALGFLGLQIGGF